MSILDAVLLGIVEGITEYLPISSTFHLIWVASLLGIPESDLLQVFQVVIQSGALMAILVLYLREIWQDRSLGYKAMVAFVPTAIIGLLLDDLIFEVFFVSAGLQIAAILLVAVIFVIIEWLISTKKITLKRGCESLSYKEALLIGVIQGAAVVPGVSRAGAVIVGLMSMSFRREEAARFSFLLAIPTILAASGYDLLKFRSEILEASDYLLALFVGFLISAITAYIVVKWFLQFLKTNTLIPFAVYRVILVGVVLLTGYLQL